MAEARGGRNLQMDWVSAQVIWTSTMGHLTLIWSWLNTPIHLDVKMVHFDVHMDSVFQDHQFDPILTKADVNYYGYAPPQASPPPTRSVVGGLAN